MGHHYIPQRYLRNFQISDRPGEIWMFPRAAAECKAVPIKAVAQEVGFFEPEVEIALNLKIEIPAQPAIDKLLSQEFPTREERMALALYMAAMLKRVPYRRNRALQLLPGVLDSTVGELRESLQSMIGNADHNQEIVHQRLQQVDEIWLRYKNEPPPEVMQLIRLPWPTGEMVGLIDQMAWRVLQTGGPSYFITSDNPAFFFGQYGLNNGESEVCFPLSSRHMLHCCWQGASASLGFFDASQGFVKEMNRRLASTTFRFALYHELVDWLPVLLSKALPQLNRIVW